jgi:hypothetical protein
MGQTSYGVWETCYSVEDILAEWNDWIKEDMEACPECYSGTLTDEELEALLNRTIVKDDNLYFLASDIQGTVLYDVMQMAGASDCGEYTVLYFSTEVAIWA